MTTLAVTPATAAPDVNVPGGPAAAVPGEPIAVPAAGSQAGVVPAERNYVPGKYIVTLTRPPIASYTGGVSGIPATKPAKGKKLDVKSRAAQQYTDVLESDQASTAKSVGVTADENYTVALNGFAADLTSHQAQALARKPGVLAVSKDTIRTADNDTNSADFLKLTGPNGVWASVGGAAQAGKGVVIGVLDTGIWPENPSFKGKALGNAPDPADPTRAYRQGDTIVMNKANGQQFTGTCEAGEQFGANLCNSKVISARYFGDAFIAGTPANLFTDYRSPRDGGGHGSHTAGTAAGNAGVQTTVDGRNYGAISGVAPGASIAVYKVLWSRSDRTSEGGYTSDIVEGIDQAVADGVDVINYSIGSSSESPADDPIALAFLSAASAGIFVSASAGNDGPGASTMDNTQPWVTTVAASTVAPREGTVVLGNGQKYPGISTTVQAPVGPAPLVAAQAAGLAGKTAAEAAICTPGTLDPAKVTGAIVECDRGVVDRVAKSAEVKRAGGIGMVLANLTDNSTDGDLHSVPSVHLNAPAGPAVKAYALTNGATAQLLPGNQTTTKMPYPQVAGFSSRGPALETNEDILKPDIAAPGVTILAAVAPPSNEDRLWDFYSGTSMAAPHIAGLAAIIKKQYPTWSPMAVKSALMTTAYDTKNADGSANTDPFAQGAGEVDATRVLNPALVYDAGQNDWLSYLEGLGYQTGTGAKAVDPTDYNQASIAAGDVLGSRVVTRKVTSVRPGLYSAAVSVPGFRVTVSPSILSFTAAGQTKQFKVTLTRTSAPLNTYAKGHLTWRGANTTVRSPIAVKSVAASASANKVTITGPDTFAQWTVRSGINGAFPITAKGLVDGNPQTRAVNSTQQAQFPVTVPAGTKLARFATHVADDTSGADIDLDVYYLTTSGARVLVGSSGGPTATETVDLIDPPAGQYFGFVNGYADAPGTTSTEFSFRSFLVGSGAPDANLTVTPSNATTTAGQQLAVTATVGGVDPDTQYLGWVGYPGGTGTIVVVNPAK
jgi:subtilisin family serine protease